MTFSKEALYIFDLHYQKREGKKLVEKTPKDVFLRISRAYKDFGLPQRITRKLVRLQEQKVAVLSSPIYYNLGVMKEPKLAACYVIDLEDDISSIGEAWKNSLLIFKGGAGVGIPITKLRPKFASIGDGGLQDVGFEGSSGPGSFMTAFHNAGDIINSFGKRRAAIICAVLISHPDSLGLMAIKAPGENRSKYTNMNISMMLTDDFVQRVRENRDFNLIWDNKVWRTLNASKMLYELAKNSHETGDPGVLFYDTINRDNLAPQLGTIESPNPCGEQPLPPNTSCNLGHVNLYQLSLEKNWQASTDSYLEDISDVAKVLVPCLDANIDISAYPPNFEKNSKFMRNIGLGISGFAAMLTRIGEAYNTEKARTIASSIMEELTLTAWEWGVKEAEEKGPAPCFCEAVSQEAYKKLLLRYGKASESEKQQQRWAALLAAAIADNYPRNAGVTTVAPTGNTSIAFDALSGGAEPLYALTYTRKVREKDDSQIKTLNMTNPEFVSALEERGIEISVSDIAKAYGKAKNLPIPSDLKIIFATAHEIHWRDRVLMQAAFQKFCTSAVSGTVNVPEETPIEEIMELYLFAHELGCKGITVFRDNCAITGILSSGKKKTKLPSYDRDPVLTGISLKAKLFDGDISRRVYITVNEDEDGNPVEVFLSVGNSGSNENGANQALGRLISKVLQAGFPLAHVIKALKGIHSSTTGRVFLGNTEEKSTWVSSIVDLVARFLEKSYLRKNVESKIIHKGKECPVCRNFTLVDQGDNCPQCECGYRKCL